MRQYKGAINLSPIEQNATAERRAESNAAESNGSGGIRAIEARLAELGEEISDLSSSIEDIKSKEQAGPLQLGCAVFGLFGLVLLVFAFFMTVARSYFGGWLFYLSLAAVIAMGVARMRRRLVSSEHLDELRSERAGLEQLLAELESERDRVEAIKENIDQGGA